MTYLVFLVVFICVPILLLLPAVRQALPLLGSRARLALAILPLLALVYTALWDNYLVWKGVWSYGPDRVVATLAYVPVEEYAFFLLQPLLTGSLLYAFLARAREQKSQLRRGTRRVGVAVLAGTTAIGFALLAEERTLYLGLILAWAAPLLLGMWLYAGRWIWLRWRPVTAAIVLSSLYLWIADRTAIVNGVWSLSSRFTIGFAPLGLPVEEAVFFLATNVMVTWGLVLLLEPGMDRPRSGRVT